MEKQNSGFMNKFQAALEKYVVPVAMKISQQKHLAAIRDGLTILVPITIIGGFPPPYKGKQNCSSALTMKKQPN